ncbi:MAG: YebC/PmpR family DNA-binding transcriptional regulator [Candidatus Marinimicrobia bacterium]|nr:YebC/PmpR family DNA-binding transcriptional regulator [Candidatus Neomarinimicrobiota bacterium]
MSGHSKWSSIKRKKAVNDAKRGAIFTRVIKEITIAARLAGGDADANPRLRVAVAQAKTANMPAANIERAIKKGTGDLPGVRYESATYEGYGPGGAAILMDIFTDNKKRTVADIRHLMTKHGGNLGETGSVAWQFENRGTLTLPADRVAEDELFDLAVEYGAEEIEADGDQFVITVPAEKAYDLQAALEGKDYAIDAVEVGLEPTSTVEVSGGEAARLLQLLDALDELEDIQKVYANCDIAEEDLAAFQPHGSSPA